VSIGFVHQGVTFGSLSVCCLWDSAAKTRSMLAADDEFLRNIIVRRMKTVVLLPTKSVHPENDIMQPSIASPKSFIRSV
jgi:hypothetical protein